MQPQVNFKRYEKKYKLNARQMADIMPVIEEHMQLDQFGKHLICNIYFDTPDFELIRASIEKPKYKEKVRLRSYGVPGKEDMVFLELKKKFDKIVYKRRTSMTMEQAIEYLYQGKELENMSQIQKELDFAIKKYDISPAVYLSYERCAYFGKEQPELRLTIDENIRCRQKDLDLRKGSFGTQLLEENTYLMEIKIPGSMPLWLSRLLSEYEVFPASFSKYGTYYKNYILPQKSFGEAAVLPDETAKIYNNQMINRRAIC